MSWRPPAVRLVVAALLGAIVASLLAALLTRQGGAGPRLFAADSVWNAPLPASAPLDPAAPRLMQAFRAEVARERQARIGPYIDTVASSTPLYTVPRSQRAVSVRLDGPPTARAQRLGRALAEVPIPNGARPAAGADRHMTIWSPATDRLWELFGARLAADGWHAKWGGAIANVSRSPGYYGYGSWPGASPDWGATATSLPVIAGTMLISELKRGVIDHALALDLPNARAGVFSWPAQRSDGTGPPSDLPEGARLRLDPSLDIASLHLPPMARMIAEAAQRYGIVVRDKTGRAIGFYGEDPGSGHDPYSGPGGLMQGATPDQVLERFPWNRLELLKMTLCRAAPCTPRSG